LYRNKVYIVTLLFRTHVPTDLASILSFSAVAIVIIAKIGPAAVLAEFRGAAFAHPIYATFDHKAGFKRPRGSEKNAWAARVSPSASRRDHDR